jgi:hypothetical protein
MPPYKNQITFLDKPFSCQMCGNYYKTRQSVLKHVVNCKEKENIIFSDSNNPAEMYFNEDQTESVLDEINKQSIMIKLMIQFNNTKELEPLKTQSGEFICNYITSKMEVFISLTEDDKLRFVYNIYNIFFEIPEEEQNIWKDKLIKSWCVDIE